MSLGDVLLAFVAAFDFSILNFLLSGATSMMCSDHLAWLREQLGVAKDAAKESVEAAANVRRVIKATQDKWTVFLHMEFVSSFTMIVLVLLCGEHADSESTAGVAFLVFTSAATLLIQLFSVMQYNEAINQMKEDAWLDPATWVMMTQGGLEFRLFGAVVCKKYFTSLAIGGAFSVLQSIAH
eukprot:UN4305